MVLRRLDGQQINHQFNQNKTMTLCLKKINEREMQRVYRRKFHYTIEAFIRFVYIIDKNRRSYLISLLQYFFNPQKRIANLFISISHFTQVVFDIMITWKHGLCKQYHERYHLHVLT